MVWPCRARISSMPDRRRWPGPAVPKKSRTTARDASAGSSRCTSDRLSRRRSQVTVRTHPAQRGLPRCREGPVMSTHVRDPAAAHLARHALPKLIEGTVIPVGALRRGAALLRALGRDRGRPRLVLRRDPPPGGHPPADPRDHAPDGTVTLTARSRARLRHRQLGALLPPADARDRPGRGGLPPVGAVRPAVGAAHRRRLLPDPAPRDGRTGTCGAASSGSRCCGR